MMKDTGETLLGHPIFLTDEDMPSGDIIIGTLDDWCRVKGVAMSDKASPTLAWQIVLVDTWQYHKPSDDAYIRFELRNESDHTTCEVNLPWTGELITLMDALELEVGKRIRYYLDG